MAQGSGLARLSPLALGLLGSGYEASRWGFSSAQVQTRAECAPRAIS